MKRFRQLLTSLMIGWLVLIFSSESIWADENHPPVVNSRASSSQASFNLPTSDELHWEPITLPPVGEITDIAIDPNDPNWIWLVTDAGGAIVSSDRGASWYKAQTRNQDYLLHGKFVTVSSTDGKTVITDSDQGGKFSGITYSRDQGQTWRGIALGEVRGPGDVYDAAFDPEDPSTVYAVKGATIFRINLTTEAVSEISGSTSGAVFRTIVVNPQNHRQILVAGQTSQGGFDAMLSLGRSETRGPFGANTKLYSSNNGGETWLEIKTKIGSIGQIAFDPKDSTILYAATTSGVFHSTDSGATWTKLADPGFPQTGVESLAIASDASVLLVGTRQGAWISQNHGMNWTSVSLPKAARERFVDSVAIDPQDSERIYLGTTNGLFYSVDGGRSTTKFTNLYNYDILMIAPDPYDSQRFFTGTGCARGIHRTDDLGQTWRWGGGNDFTREFLTGLDNHYQMDIDIALINPNIVWNTTAQGVYKSVDGGLTWKNIDHEVTRVPMTEPAHLPWWHFHGMGIHPTDPNIVIVGNGTGGLANVPGPSETFVIRTEDGGKNWEKIILSSNILSSIQDVVFDPFDPKIIYVPTHTEPWGMFEGSQQTSQGLFKSTDGGKTFARFDHGLTNLEMSAFAVSYQTPGLSFAMGHSELGHAGSDHLANNSEMAVLSVSHDNGQHWESIELPIAASGVASHNGFVLDPLDDKQIFIATNQGLLRSRDGGTVWTVEHHGLPETMGMPSYLTIDRRGNRLYLVTQAETGPAIFTTVLRNLAAQDPPVTRIDKSETEQFGEATGRNGWNLADQKTLNSWLAQSFVRWAALVGGIFIILILLFIVLSVVKRRLK